MPIVLALLCILNSTFLDLFYKYCTCTLFQTIDENKLLITVQRYSDKVWAVELEHMTFPQYMDGRECFTYNSFTVKVKVSMSKFNFKRQFILD